MNKELPKFENPPPPPPRTDEGRAWSRYSDSTETAHKKLIKQLKRQLIKEIAMLAFFIGCLAWLIYDAIFNN